MMGRWMGVVLVVLSVAHCIWITSTRSPWVMSVQAPNLVRQIDVLDELYEPSAGR